MSDTEKPATPWADLDAYRVKHRAANPIPAFDTVVAALAERKQWLMWKYEKGETPDKKPRKMPYWANGKKRRGVQGDEQDRAALGNYTTVAEAALKRGFDGVGFAFLPGDGLIGIDLDGMIDPDTGDISERCSGIIKACDSYTEYSPSGKGVHIICLGTSRVNKDNGVGVEIFAEKQYFTFTGRLWPGAPETVNPIPERTLKRLHKTVDDAKKGASKAAAPLQDTPIAKGAKIGGRQRSIPETVALAEDAISHIDPNDYQQWIDIGLACKEGLGLAGYFVWDAWSSNSPKYAGADDTQRRWAGFKPTKITLGTLFSLAASSGWVSPWEQAKARKQRNAKSSTSPQDPAAETPSSPPPETIYTATSADAGGGDPPDDWENRLLCGKQGDLVACVANVHDIIIHMPRWDGVVAFDEFAQRTVKRKPPPYINGAIGPWEDNDDTQTAMWLTRQWGFAPDPGVVGKAIEALAKEASFNPVKDYLRSRPKWDGVKRCESWLVDYAGVTDSPYVRLVSRFFLIGMVARVMKPGVKFDYCLVLEGEQGKRKSMIARVLGGEWYGDTDLNLENKDSMSAISGKWVYEFAEMGSVTRAESTKQKSFLSRQFDEFRPVYGKRMVCLARQVVFIGTTNEEEWNKDATGGRRFWSVKCLGDLNPEGLEAMRDQLLAEALELYDQGERFWPNDDEQRTLFNPEQAQREQQEAYVDALHDWVYAQVAVFSIADAAMTGLKLDASKLTRDVQTRIGQALRKLGCTRTEKRNGIVRYVYLPPHMKGGTDTANAPAASPSAAPVGEHVAGF